MEHHDKIDELLTALDSLCMAVHHNSCDTMGRLMTDKFVLFNLGGSWTGSSSFTLGDARKIAQLVNDIKAPKGNLN